MTQHCNDLAKTTVIQSLRKTQNLTQPQFAKLLDIKLHSLIAWEDSTAPPLTQQLEYVQKCLKITGPLLRPLLTALADATLAHLDAAAASIIWEFELPENPQRKP